MKKLIVLSVFSAMVFGLLATGRAEYDYSKGTKPSMYGKPIQTEADVTSLKKNDSIAMACSKCKSVMIIKKKDIATKAGKGSIEEAMSFDQCPGCGGKMVTKSSGKETKFVHTCSECGDDSAFCCATGKNEGKTSGM